MLSYVACLPTQLSVCIVCQACCGSSKYPACAWHVHCTVYRLSHGLSSAWCILATSGFLPPNNNTTFECRYQVIAVTQHARLRQILPLAFMSCSAQRVRQGNSRRHLHDDKRLMGSKVWVGSAVCVCVCVFVCSPAACRANLPVGAAGCADMIDGQECDLSLMCVLLKL